MSARKLLLILGILFVGAGLWLALMWFQRATAPVSQTAEPKPDNPAILIAHHPIPSGTLLRKDDITWKEVAAAEIRPGFLARGNVSESEFLGAITRRNFGEGEALIASELVKPSDRRFLAAVLRPGHRAVSISVDAPQSASGLVLPGDYVDIILTQNFGDAVVTAAQRSVGETVLHNVRVVAVDQSLSNSGGAEEKKGAADARVPKTITLEANERQAQKLFVAMQLGKLQLAVRPLEAASAALTDNPDRANPIWASDVSKAIRQMAFSNLRPISSGSTVESAVRRPPPANSP
jgi:pilus assembly protein CpaB